MLASQLYALSQGSECFGKEECHYCGAPCTQHIYHNEPTLIPGMRRAYVAKRPGNSFVCLGCWLWRRKSITAEWLDQMATACERKEWRTGELKDRQTPAYHSWLIIKEKAWAVKLFTEMGGVIPINNRIYQILLDPPCLFCLSLVEGCSNHLQLSVANENEIVKAETPLTFTFNGIPYVYTVYELEDELRNSSGGKLPGVSQLIRLLGPCDLFPTEEKVVKMGRPEALKGGHITQKRVVAASGMSGK